MRITYTITAQDLVEANRLHFSRGGPSSIRMSLKMMFVAGLLIIVAILANLILNPGTAQLARVIPMLLLALFLVSLTTVLIPFSVRRAYSKDKRLHGEFSAEISESGIGISSPDSQTQMNWKGFIRFFETKNLFVLYHSAQLFNTFPKRAFAPEQLEEVRSLLQQKVPAG